MRFPALAPVLALTILALNGAAQDCPKCDACPTCGKETFGTSIEWEADGSTAAAKAKKEEKLVFVLHVSGKFEDPDFT